MSLQISLMPPADLPAFVVKARDIAALNFFPAGHVRPCHAEWIDRGTGKALRSFTAQQLLRTLYRPDVSPSVARLHDAAGLRARFPTEHDRNRFAGQFREAQARAEQSLGNVVTAIFPDRAAAEFAISQCTGPGIPADAFSILWRGTEFLENELQWPMGHGTADIAGASAGGGVLGAMVGIALFSVPGIGPVAAAGALAATGLSSIAAVSGILGATGAALAKMLSDFDVDGVAAGYLGREIRKGSVFVTVDKSLCASRRENIQLILLAAGGRVPRP